MVDQERGGGKAAPGDGADCPELRVLIVEDDPDDYALASAHLASASLFRARVFHATRLQGAFDVLEREGGMDVVLLDLSLPDSHGLATYERLGERVQLAAVVVLTGNNDEATGLRAVRAGAEEYLIKSTTTSALLCHVVRYAVERRRFARERENLIRQLADALTEVRSLRGLLPICAQCKKIRDSQGEWQHLEQYVSRHSHATFTHGYCPECATRLLDEGESASGD